MSLYRRGKTYWCQFTVKGQRYRLSTEHTNRELAKDIESALRVQAMQDHGLAPRKVPTLREFIPHFVLWVENSGKSADTQRDYKNCCEILKLSALSGMRLDRINTDEVQTSNLPGANSYKNHAIRTLRRLLSFAVGKRYITLAPRLQLYREYGRDRIITPDEEAAVMANASPVLKDALVLMIDCGMRRKEVARIRIEDIDWTAQALRVPDGKTKNARRIVGLSKRALDAVFVRSGARREGWLFTGQKKKGTAHVTPDALSRAFRRAANAAGLSADVVLYSARHTFGTYVYEATGNLAVVMKSMGHGSMAIAQRYQHPELDVTRDAANARNECHSFRHTEKQPPKKVAVSN